MAEGDQTRRRRRRPMSEINVVPYIDVMLVLLVIFMITAPLLQQGVDIELPKADAEPLSQPSEPVVISVTEQGDLYLSIGGQSELIDKQGLIEKVSAFVRRNPEVPVLVGGDQRVPYGRIYQTMVTLQEAGVEKVGLMSDPPENREGGEAD